MDARRAAELPSSWMAMKEIANATRLTTNPLMIDVLRKYGRQTQRLRLLAASARVATPGSRLCGCRGNATRAARVSMFHRSFA